MNKDEIFNALVNDDDSQQQMLSDLESALNEALSLPENERDYSAIAELTAAIAEISGGELDKDEEERNIAAVLEETTAADKRRKIDTIIKWATALSACFVLGVAMNIYTSAAFGADLFTTAVMFTKNGFSFDFAGFDDPYEHGETIIATSSEDTGTTTTYNPWWTIPWLSETTATTAVQTDASTETSVIAPVQTEPESMARYLSFSREQGVFPCYPVSGIFDDMPLTDYSVEDSGLSKDLYFTFMNDEQRLDIMVEVYHSREEIPSFLVPTDEPDYETYPSNVGTVFVFGQEGYSTAVFAHDNILYTIVGQNMDAQTFIDAATSFTDGQQN
jgi:hypothetical protein